MSHCIHKNHSLIGRAPAPAIHCQDLRSQTYSHIEGVSMEWRCIDCCSITVLDERPVGWALELNDSVIENMSIRSCKNINTDMHEARILCSRDVWGFLDGRQRSLWTRINKKERYLSATIDSRTLLYKELNQGPNPPWSQPSARLYARQSVYTYIEGTSNFIFYHYMRAFIWEQEAWTWDQLVLISWAFQSWVTKAFIAAWPSKVAKHCHDRIVRLFNVCTLFFTEALNFSSINWKMSYSYRILMPNFLMFKCGYFAINFICSCILNIVVIERK